MKKIMIFIIAVFSFLGGQNAFAGEISYFDVDFGTDNVEIGEALELLSRQWMKMII